MESGWTSREDHHDRLLNLLGHKAGSEPAGIEPPALAGTARVVGVPRPAGAPAWDEAAVAVARASFILLLAHDRAGGPAPKSSEVAAARSRLRGFCGERAEEFRAMRAKYGDYEVLKRRRMDLGMGATSKEAQLLHRYEMAHEKSLYAALRQLVALERSGADLIDIDEPDPPPAEAAPPPPADPEPHVDAPVKVVSSTSSASGSVGAATTSASGSVGAGDLGSVPSRPAAPSRASKPRSRPASAGSGGGSTP